MKKFALILLVFIVLTGAVTGGIIYIKQPYTPPIRNGEGKNVPGSIARLEQVEVGGFKQWILVRGKDTSKPILLFLHGGPGMPLMYLAHAFQRPLEKDFIVVQWDRRGAGKTYTAKLSPDDLSVSRLLSDTTELVRLLLKRFGKKKIYLVGHSFGSYLGMLFVQEHPELVKAFISVGQVVDSEAAHNIQRRFILKRARETGQSEIIKNVESNKAISYEPWLFEFGGELWHATSWWPLLWTGVKAPEYSLSDVAKVPKGSNFSSRYMTYDVIDGDLRDHVKKVEVPVYFFTGRHDYTTPFELVERYCDSLKAPHKEMVWFNDSAHFPFLEQPAEFATQMRKVLIQSQLGYTKGNGQVIQE